MMRIALSDIHKIAIAALAFVTLNATAAVGAPVTVYEVSNISIGARGFGFPPAFDELGQTITLAESSRYIRQLDIALGGNIDTPLQLRFYQLDGAAGQPDSLIWESDVFDFMWAPPNYNRKFVTIEVPDIQVPETFAVVVANLVEANAGRVALQNGSDVGIGQPGEFWARRIGEAHFENYGNFRVGMIIHAVPEPAPSTLALVGVFLFCHRRRRLLSKSRRIAQ